MATEKPKKTGDALTLRIADLRKEIRQKVKEELFKECKEFQKQGKYPWEGMWLKPQDIRKIQDRMKKRDRIVFLEIITFFLFMALFSYGFYMFITLLLPR